MVSTSCMSVKFLLNWGSWSNDIYFDNVAGNCKIRRVFTLKSQPFDTIDTADDVNDRASCESIPQSLQFPNSVPFHTQVSLHLSHIFVSFVKMVSAWFYILYL